MADRPIVLRSRTNAQKLVHRYRTATQHLMDQGPTGSGMFVTRMRTAAGRLAHQYRTATQSVVHQGRLSLDTRLMTMAETSAMLLVWRRKFEEPLVGQFRTATQRLVDQFPTYTDFTR